jgi:hypothetical protein
MQPPFKAALLTLDPSARLHTAALAAENRSL